LLEHRIELLLETVRKLEERETALDSELKWKPITPGDNVVVLPDVPALTARPRTRASGSR